MKLSSVSGHSCIQCFWRLNSLATQWFFQLWEELKIRTTSRKRHYFPLVFSENTVYSFCNMKSCVVVEWTVTIIFSNTSLKKRWTDDFGILDFITMSSHAIHLSPSKMAAIMATSVLSVEVLSPLEGSLCSVWAWPWQNLWDQCGIVQWSNVVSPHFCCQNL